VSGGYYDIPGFCRVVIVTVTGHHRAMKRWLPWLAALGLVIGLLNFLWFISESGIGGRPAPGIDPAWFRWHSGSVFLTHAFGMAGGAYLLFTVVFPDLVRRGGPEVSASPATSIEGTGDLIAGRRVAGRLGDLRLGGPILRVAIYPGEILLRPPFMAPVRLPTEAIEGTAQDRDMFGYGARRLWIAHHEPTAPTPIMLYVGPDDPIAVAITAMARGVTVDLGHAKTHPESGAPVQKYPAVMKALILLGIGMAPLVLIVINQAVFKGIHSPFEALWLFLGIGILGANIYRYVIRDRHRW
jgi:hypothetical protein